ncbi:hypothetical protein J6590_047695 [Homalodisca vitripennis]|nr:hypothetical protein J6590_047695 [Homalodisca vitripennis]
MGKWSTENSKADRRKHKLTVVLHFHAPNQLLYLICTELCEPWSTRFMGKWSTENSADRRKHKLRILHFTLQNHLSVPNCEPWSTPSWYYTSTLQNQLLYLICTELCEPWSTRFMGKWSTENSKADRRKHKLTVVLHFHAPKPTTVPYLYRTVRAMVYTLHGRKHKLTVVLHFHAPKPTTVPYLYRTVRAMVYTLHGRKHKLTALLHFHAPKPTTVPYLYRTVRAMVYTLHGRKHKLTVVLYFHAPKPTTVLYLYRTVRAMVYTLHGKVVDRE